MKANEKREIITLYIDDSPFREMISSSMLSKGNEKIVEHTNCQIVTSCWCLAYVKLKEEYKAVYDAWGYKNLAVHETCLAFVLTLISGLDTYLGIYVPYSGKIVILPQRVIECKKQLFYCFTQSLQDKFDYFGNREVKQRSFVGFFDRLFFIKEVVTRYECATVGSKQISRFSKYQLR